MKYSQLDCMQHRKGFVAALDQSGGSTPKALRLYGINKDQYNNEAEMFDLVHEMRTRIIKSPAFTDKRILGAILFEMTMDRKIDGKYTADYLWNEKGIVPFLKVDKGLADPKDGVRMMKPNPGLPDLLKKAEERNIFGTKMRSVILEPNRGAIKGIVKQQFDTARIIIDAGMVPIIEPEVDINAHDKAECEHMLYEEILIELGKMKHNDYLMFKLTLPETPNLYKKLIEYPCVVRVVALSGGYSQEESLSRLAENEGVIASFSRALTEKLFVNQSEEEFDKEMDKSIEKIYKASVE